MSYDFAALAAIVPLSESRVHPMKIRLLVLLPLAVSACATVPDSGEAREERTYRTGSHLPVKEGAPASGVQSQDPSTMQIPPNMQLPRGASGG
jgi:hypothetical protein